MKVKYTVEKKNYGMQVEFHKCVYIKDVKVFNKIAIKV